MAVHMALGPQTRALVHVTREFCVEFTLNTSPQKHSYFMLGLEKF